MSRWYPDWYRESLLVARVELRREIRRVRKSSMVFSLQLLAVFIGVFWIVGSLPLAGYDVVWETPGAYVFGEQFDSEPAPVVEMVRGAAGVLVVLTGYGVTLRVLTDDEDKELPFVAGSPRSAALGVLISHGVFLGCVVGPIVVSGAIAFAAGSGTPAVAVTIILSAALAHTLTVAVGGLGALAALAVVGHTLTGRRLKLLVGAPLAAGYFALFLWSRRAVDVLATTPLGWFGDLALLGAGHRSSPAAAATLLLATVTAVCLTVVAFPPLARIAWLDRAGHRKGTSSEPGTDVPVLDGDSRFGFVDSLVARPTAAVVRAYWHRISREPRTLFFTLAPAAVIGSVANELTALRPNSLPLVVAIYGSVAVGVGPSLNLLGNESTGLPLALSTPGGGRSLLRGYLLATWLPGTLLVVTATVLAGTLTTLPVAAVAGIGLLAGLLTGTAVSLSLLIGTLMPEWDGLGATSRSSFQFPRIEAVGLLTMVMTVLGGPALAGGFFAADLTSTAPAVLAVAGVGVTVVGAAVAGAGSYLLVARRLRSYDAEQLP